MSTTAEFAERVRRTAERYRRQRGNHMSAAVAFYTVIAAVPLLMVVFASLTSLLFWRATSERDLVRVMTALIPQGMVAVLEPVLDAAVQQSSSLLGIGAVGVLWSGSTWTAYLREALSAQYRLEADRIISPRRFLGDLGALAVLSVAVLGSVAVTLAVTGLAGVTLELLGLRDALGGRITLRVFGTVVVLGLDWLVLCFVLARLPRRPVARSRVVRPAAVGAVALEVLKLVGVLVIGSVSGTASGAVFGSVLVVLFFLFLVCRLLVVLTAWIATDGTGEGVVVEGRVLEESSEPDVVEDAPERLGERVEVESGRE